MLSKTFMAEGSRKGSLWVSRSKWNPRPSWGTRIRSPRLNPACNSASFFTKKLPGSVRARCWCRVYGLRANFMVRLEQLQGAIPFRGRGPDGAGPTEAGIGLEVAGATVGASTEAGSKTTSSLPWVSTSFRDISSSPPLDCKTEAILPSDSEPSNASPSGTMAAMPNEANNTTPPTIPIRSHRSRFLFCICINGNLGWNNNNLPEVRHGSSTLQCAIP